MPASLNQTIDHLFRYESGKMVAVLSKLLGLQQLETAQDLVQDSLLQALNTWSLNGIPDNPSAWLHRVAKNKAIDFATGTCFKNTLRTEFCRNCQSPSYC